MKYIQHRLCEIVIMCINVVERTCDRISSMLFLPNSGLLLARRVGLDAMKNLHLSSFSTLAMHDA